jgi:hypothetical protein
MRIIEFAYAEQRFEKLIVPHSEMVEKIVYSGSRLSKNFFEFCPVLCAFGFKGCKQYSETVFIKNQFGYQRTQNLLLIFLNPLKMLQTSSYKKVVGVKREGVIWFFIF